MYIIQNRNRNFHPIISSVPDQCRKVSRQIRTLSRPEDGKEDFLLELPKHYNKNLIGEIVPEFPISRPRCKSGGYYLTLAKLTQGDVGRLLNP